MAAPSKYINVIDFVGQATYELWKQRAAIAPLAFVPFVLEAITVFLFIIFDLQDNVLRQGLYSLPSYSVKGIFIAIIIRRIILKEHWPDVLTGDAQEDQKRLTQRRRAIKASSLMYVLLHLLGIASIGLVIASNPNTQQAIVTDSAEMQEISAFMSMFILMAASGLIFASIWAIRYTTLYVPIALGIGPRAFLRKILGLKASFQIIMITLCCAAPAVLALIFTDSLVRSLLGGAVELTSDHLVYSFLFSCVQSAFNTALSAVWGVSFAHYVVSVMRINQKDNQA